MTNVKFTILALAKKIWPKVSAYALLGVLSALVAVIFKSYIPDANCDKHRLEQQPVKRIFPEEWDD